MSTTPREQSFRSSIGNAYSYTFTPPQSDSPTLLFLHGFPSHKTDWHHQREHFANLGHGVLCLDLLGFGRSAAPDTQDSYRLKSMSNEIIELLDHLHLESPVIGIGHDLGAMFLSRLTTYHAARIAAIVYLSVGPNKLSQPFDVDAINTFTKSVLGHEYLGYISWMTSDPDAQAELETHAESAMKLLFCDDPKLWDTAFRPAGAMKAFVTQDQDVKIGPWFTTDMQREHLELYKQPGGYKGAIKWYKMMANNDSLVDEKEVADHQLDKPALLIAPEQESAQQKEMAASWHPQLQVESLSCGHWVHLERPAETNKLIEDFIAGVGLGSKREESR
ncbi:epoxide hydrolase [Sarocladium strictum]